MKSDSACLKEEDRLPGICKITVTLVLAGPCHPSTVVHGESYECECNAYYEKPPDLFINSSLPCSSNIHLVKCT